ncbi:cilia- and flagella-associated protein 300-like [Periplaneta americana]|uniref:cilia- and flagella-associated protein 300-like n=1 Tax=Periplaneta americana TaxID=6978 RepID=UPI0037E981C1
MDEKYTFVYSESKKFNVSHDTTVQNLLMKWSMKGQIKLQTYCFNQPFQLHQKHALANAFFSDPVVISTLQTMSGRNSWTPVGVKAVSVDVEHVPCSAISMSMFNCLQDPANGIVREDGFIMQSPYEEIDNFPVADELRRVLLDEDCPNYSLFSEAQRSEFIFRLFKHFCLGGEWCQYEDNIKPYLHTTKAFYKETVRVQKDPITKQLTIASVVLKVTAKGENGLAFFPCNPENHQNCAYLVIDLINRQITSFVHQYGGTF